MASDEQSNQAAPESLTDEQVAPSTAETLPGESAKEDIEQLKAERDQYKRDYAALKKDYDKNARESKSDKKMPEDETLWYIENAGDLRLVRAEYEKNLSELTSLGAKATIALRQKALALAKAEKGVTSNPEIERQASTASPTPVTNRTVETSDEVVLSETDMRFGVKPETIKKWKHLVEGQ